MSFCSILRLVAFSVATFLSIGSIKADVIDLDTSALPEELVPFCVEAEKIWEARLQAYSTELPLAIRMQLTTLRISCFALDVDGPDGILGFAGPDSVLSYQLATPFETTPNRTVALTASLYFDIADSAPTDEAGERLLLETAVHEIGHCLGFGTLFAENNLLGNQNANGTGLVQFTGGKYALAAYRKAINQSVRFIPTQAGGGHWNEAEGLIFFDRTPVVQDVMLAFASTIDPSTGEIITPVNIITDTTWGALADLGFAITGINGQFAAPPGTGTGSWPKIIGQGTDPFASNGVNALATRGLSYRILKLRASYRVDKTSGKKTEVGKPEKVDPYNLRNLRWTKPTQTPTRVQSR